MSGMIWLLFSQLSLSICICYDMLSSRHHLRRFRCRGEPRGPLCSAVAPCGTYMAWCRHVRCILPYYIIISHDSFDFWLSLQCSEVPRLPSNSPFAVFQLIYTQTIYTFVYVVFVLYESTVSQRVSGLLVLNAAPFETHWRSPTAFLRMGTSRVWVVLPELVSWLSVKSSFYPRWNLSIWWLK